MNCQAVEGQRNWFCLFMNCQTDKADKTNETDKTDEGMQPWHCLSKKKWGRMIRWNKDFVQWGDRVYFDKHIDPKLYVKLSPNPSIINQGPYQDPLIWKKEGSTKIIDNFPYNITRTKDRIILKYLTSSAYFILDEDSSGHLFRSWEAKNPDHIVETYYSFVDQVYEINFDLSTNILTEVLHKKLTEKVKWHTQASKIENGIEIFGYYKTYVTPEKNKEIYQKLVKSFGKDQKYVQDISTCKKDTPAKSKLVKSKSRLYNNAKFSQETIFFMHLNLS